MSWQHVLKTMLLVAIGCALISFAAFNVVSTERQYSWPQARARILNSEIIQHNDAPEIKLEVHYSANDPDLPGLLYTRAFDAIGDGFLRRVQTDRIPDRFAKGQTVSVYYDPDFPQIAVLDLPSRGWTYASSAAFVLLGLAIIIFGSTLEATYVFVKFQQWRMHRHLNAAKKSLSEGEALAGNQNTRDIRAARSLANEQWASSERLASEMDREVEILESVFHEDTPDRELPKTQPPAPACQPPIGVAGPVREAVFCLMIPAILALLVSWFVPYFNLTLQSRPDGVECRVEQALLGIFPIANPQTINRLKEVRAESRGTRTARHFLILTGDNSLTIPALHARDNQKRIADFLEASRANSQPRQLRMSAGPAFFGIYVPWVLLVLGAVVSLSVVSEFGGRPSTSGRNATGKISVQRKPTPVGQFLMGMFITWSVFWLGFVVLQDPDKATGQQWSIILIISAIGGLVQMRRSR